MENIKKFPATFLYLSVLFGALWFGSYFLRLTITYRIFEGIDFTLRNYLNEQNLPAVLKSFQPAVISTLVLYAIFIISFFLFLISSKLRLKENGWLFIATVIIIITLPLESYLSYIDYSMVHMLSANNFNANEVLGLIIKRFKMFSSFPVIELFCYGAIIYFLIFQPFTKKKIV
ncbi:MAG TPA: hypothetical protein VKA26_08870 [Ignavibacteriaceae bacterium]|nr:hypothetical protein [Ignavibacteriaceae bacterium]